MKPRTLAALLALALVLALGGCTQCGSTPKTVLPATPESPQPVPGVPVGAIPGHDSLAQDTTPKEGPRLLSAETYIRSLLQLFGGLSPLDLQTKLRAGG